MIRYLLDPQGGDGNGTPTPPADLATTLKALIADKQGGDASAVAMDLLRKNRELEADNRNYRKKLGDLKKAMPEGSIVLSGDDAKKWSKYRELGEPAEVKASLDSGRDAASKLEAADRVGVSKKAARLVGYDPDVFADLAEAKGLQVEVIEETRDGKAVEVPFVRGEGDTRTPLTQFGESHLSGYLPALTQGQSPSPRDRVRDATPPRRSPFVAPRLDDDADEERPLVDRAAYAT